MHSYVWPYIFHIVDFLVPTILGLLSHEDFEAPLSSGAEKALCSAETANDVSSARSRIQCAALCHRNPRCMEFNFRINTKSCEFYYCRASHDLQPTPHCSNYQSQKLLSGDYGNACVNELIRPEKCSFPFTYEGNQFFECTSNLTSARHEYGCYDGTYTWKSCGLPRDYVTSETIKNITIPSCPQVTTIRSVNNWFIFHRRADETLQYNRSWADYKKGFGDRSSDYWLGLENLSCMTSLGTWRLKLVMKSLNDSAWVSVEYDTFKVDSEALGYALQVSTNWYGDVNNLITGQNGAKFSTYDKDNDLSPTACSLAPNYGGFWYGNCHKFCLTCVYGTSYSYKLPNLKVIVVSESNMMMKLV